MLFTVAKRYVAENARYASLIIRCCEKLLSERGKVFRQTTLTAVVAVWEEKHIAVARMIMKGVTKTSVRKSKQALAKLQARDTLLKHEDYFSWRTFLSYLTGIYTREEFDMCIQQRKNGYFPTRHSIHGRAVQPTGCILYIHSQTN